MAGSTGPIMAAGGIVVFNNVIVMGQAPIENTRIVVGTLIAAGGLAMLERAAPQVATALAWLALVAVLLVRVTPNTPSPVESFQAWYKR
jgi:hypothetical protein